MSDRASEEWPLQAEMDLRDVEAEDAYRQHVNDHVRGN